MFPEIGLSVGFTSTICVVQPAPSAKCGNNDGSRRGCCTNVDNRKCGHQNSARSFAYPRNSIIATGPKRST